MGRMRALLVWLAAVAVCLSLAASPADSAGLSLHASQLTPALALLTWSGFITPSWLSLSLDSHSGSQRQLSLPASSPAHLLITGRESHSAVDFTLCERDSNQRQHNPLSDPHCTHATLLAHSATTLDGRQQWDLSGAGLHAEVTRSPSDPSAHRISWSASPVSADPAAPPLLYSVFAEWTAPTLSADDLREAAHAATADAPLTPSLQTHSVRMCSTQSDDQRTQLHCDVAADRLPRGVQLTLHLLTECDYQRIDAETAVARLPRCLSSISPELRVTLEPSLADNSATVIEPSLSADPLPAAPSPLSFLAAPGVAQVTNDAAVREALCTFFNQTSGPQWSNHFGWCDSVVPICRNGTQHGWFGVDCDATSGVVTALRLPDNGLVSASDRFVDISPLFIVLNQLESLDLTNNELWLSQLDLTPLSDLLSLRLARLSAAAIGSLPLFLPSPACHLSLIDIGTTGYAVADWSACTQITSIDITYVNAPFPLALITRMPLLQQLNAFNALVTGDVVGSYGGGLSGGELTLFIFAHLNESNPQLQLLDLTNCADLPFGLPGALDNWPRVVSPSLTSLTLGGLNLRTGPSGPAVQDWLSDLPSLRRLSMLGLPGVTARTADFAYASRSLQTWLCDAAILGDLSPLLALPSLTDLELSNSGLRSALPTNISDSWANLTTLKCSSCAMWGELPNFHNLPMLTQVDLTANALSGSIGADWAQDSPLLHGVTLSSNQVTVLQLGANPMGGQLPTTLWQQMPAIQTLDLAQTLLNGSIPDRDPTLPSMNQFLASGCAFSGRLPLNIDAKQVDLSHNHFEGPLILFDERFLGFRIAHLTSLQLASAGRLSCPIQISALTDLSSMDLSNCGFDGCSWSNVTLPPSLTQLDISHDNWLPFDIAIPPSLLSLRAVNASIRGVSVPPTSVLLSIEELILDLNLWNPSGNGAGWSIQTQLSWILYQYGVARALRSFSCQACGLSLAMTELMSVVSSSRLQILRLQSNALHSHFSALVSSFPPSLIEFSVDAAVDLIGWLPPTAVLQSLRSFGFGGTSLSGSIPPSWTNLPSLEQLNISGTSIQCDLLVTADSTLQCADQSVIAASSTISIESTSLADPAAGVHCSALTIVATGSSSVAADPSYHSYTECRCDSNSFGLNALCYRCPEGCTCLADRISDCFPVVRRGSVVVSSASDAVGSRSVVAGSIAPFSVTALLPCPRTVTGDTLCNPDGIAWPSFYRIIEQAGPASVSASLEDADSSPSSASGIALSSWCSAGHTGRLCSACSSSYFSSGRWCLQCLSEGAHVIILIANLMLIVALIAYLFAKAPSAMTAARGLRLYLSRVAQSAGVKDVSRPMQSFNRDSADSALPSLSASSSFSSLSAAADSPDSPTSEAANPLKLLIFHSQQLSLLLHTSTSLPPVMSGLLSALHSGSTGFSLSSLIAMECLTSWTLSARCWMAVVAPMLIGLVAAVTAVFSRSTGSEGSRSAPRAPRRSNPPAMELQGRDEPLLRAEAEHAHESASFVSMDEQSAELSARGLAPSSIAPRIYSVCVSLLYFLFFPCAGTVLSAVCCTDHRDSGRSFLNLSPDQACDDEWRRAILPPAIIGLLWWVAAFPLGSTIMLWRIRDRIAADAESDSASVASSVSASASASASPLSVWPACSDLLLPYSPRFWYWDQLLLLRRFLLVGAVSVIPASSLYLPLVLLLLIQLSALQQHWAAPFAQPWLNRGELASLYLIIINYTAASILQTGLTDGGFQQTANGWAAALFSVNAAFLLILVAGLFGWARKWIATRLSASRQRR